MESQELQINLGELDVELPEVSNVLEGKSHLYWLDVVGDLGASFS